MLKLTLPFALMLTACGPTMVQAKANTADFTELLDRSAVAADKFTQQHTTWDGRGVVIAVLDTGVDPSVPGLRRTTDGQIKVIAARDFSGEGDVTMERGRLEAIDGVMTLRTDGGVVTGIDQAGWRVRGNSLWLGFFDEANLAESSVNDVDRNGRVDDTFAVVAFYETNTNKARVIIDLDGDGSLADETVRGDFEDDLTHFSFSNPDPKKDQSPVAFTVTVMPDDERRVEFHFDDGGHGTHCAGIAAGHRIEGRQGFDGIAPGARVISLKIGNNALAGGATTPGSMERAITFASEWARKHNTPVVMNISYGIGSEHEGYAGIDGILDEALADNALLVASVAAGNDGPGLSTVGTPGASHLAWTAGAFLGIENGQAMWGSGAKNPRVFGFSSRGGELDKPDGLSPGAAWSSVPPFHRRAVMAGTSMATPQAAGAHALLISAAKASAVPWNSGLLKRAFKTTATPVKGYNRLDQGAGLINIPAAFKALKGFDAGARAGVLLGWKVKTDVPHRPGTEGSGSFWRTGMYVPTPSHRISFTLEPIFFKGVSDSVKSTFFESFNLKSSQRWLNLDRKKLAIRQDGSATWTATIESSKVKAHGVHVGLIQGYAKGQRLASFEVPVSIVRPHTTDDLLQDHAAWTSKLKPGEIERHFFAIPAGAETFRLTQSPAEGRYTRSRLYLYDPEGREFASAHRSSNSESGAEAIFELSGERLTPGVWEAVTYATFRNTEVSEQRLSAQFLGLNVPHQADYWVPDGGGVKTSIELINRFDAAIRGPVTAKLLGAHRALEEDVDGPEFEHFFTVAPQCSGAKLSLSMSAEDYHLFTDIAVNVINASGAVVAQSGFGARLLDLNIQRGPGEYRLVIKGATADITSVPTWSIRIDETHTFATPVPMTVSGPTSSDPTFYPGVLTPLDIETATSLPERPEDFGLVLELSIRDRLNKGVRSDYRVTLQR